MIGCAYEIPSFYSSNQNNNIIIKILYIRLIYLLFRFLSYLSHKHNHTPSRGRMFKVESKIVIVHHIFNSIYSSQPAFAIFFPVVMIAVIVIVMQHFLTSIFFCRVVIVVVDGVRCNFKSLNSHIYLHGLTLSRSYINRQTMEKKRKEYAMRQLCYMRHSYDSAGAFSKASYPHYVFHIHKYVCVLM